MISTSENTGLDLDLDICLLLFRCISHRLGWEAVTEVDVRAQLPPCAQLLGCRPRLWLVWVWEGRLNDIISPCLRAPAGGEALRHSADVDSREGCVSATWK